MMMLYSVAKIYNEMERMDDETSYRARESLSRASQNDGRPLWFKPPNPNGWGEYERAFSFFPPTML